jgi:hypothetical protein
MKKIIASKTISNKEILVPVCPRPSWWNKSFELILVNLVRILRFMWVMISFPTTAFIVDGSFENIGIDFCIFFIFLFLWLCDLSSCISLEGLLFFVIYKKCIDEW